MTIIPKTNIVVGLKLIRGAVIPHCKNQQIKKSRSQSDYLIVSYDECLLNIIPVSYENILNFGPLTAINL